MSYSRIALLALAGTLLVGTGVPPASAGESSTGPRTEVSLMGGVQALNKNDSALPDRFVNVPVVGSVAYHLNSNLAAEGEFTWLAPIKQNVDLGSGVKADRKTPDILAYQAGLRASFPTSSVVPYVAAGAGAVTFLSNTDSDRVPQLSKSETAFAVNFGGGLTYGLNERWGVRADVRELVAFPRDGAAGLSDASGADQIWMERGTVGLSYRF